MSRTPLLKSVLAMLFFLAALAYPFLTPPIPARPESPASEFGERDDADARDRFEELRLRDPRTGMIPAGILDAEREFAETI